MPKTLQRLALVPPIVVAGLLALSGWSVYLTSQERQAAIRSEARHAASLDDRTRTKSKVSANDARIADLEARVKALEGRE